LSLGGLLVTLAYLSATYGPREPIDSAVTDGHAYAAKITRVLDGVSFTALPGETIGIVGATGAGKSTLVSLVPRFVDPDEGRVLIDDQDLRDVQIESLRKQISIVLQDPILLSGGIRESISDGEPDATMDDVVRAATAANAHEFTVHKPAGYDTAVGERGVTLSGGERQRIVLHMGRMVESGTHQELRAPGGLYHELHQRAAGIRPALIPAAQ